MDKPANAKVFIIKTEYGYAVSPSPVVVPGGATLGFENLTGAGATVSIPGKEPLELHLGPYENHEPVPLPPGKERVIFYKVDMGDELLARGNSAPIIIRDA